MNLKFVTEKSLKLYNKKAPILRGTCESRKVGRKPPDGWKETEQSAVFRLVRYFTARLLIRSSALTEPGTIKKLLPILYRCGRISLRLSKLYT